ncbi:MAG: S-methyl-5-thioribose-1-phosphate isomerase [bacterium]|nr:S-methyl-5-thioribose-1-phosphate isomerase [bacterium]
MLVNGKPYRTVWMERGDVKLINQPLLPHRFEIHTAHNHLETARAISDMIVRGAPAIGATAAYGMAQVVMAAPNGPGREAAIRAGYEVLRATRPTAQNLFHALDRIWGAVKNLPASEQAGAAVTGAETFAVEEIEACRRIGESGAALIEDGMRVLTHCNAGWLACVDWGTALSPIYVAHRAGRRVSVFADETRPRCQGANLTAWELAQEGVPVEIVADNAAGILMRRGEVQLVITGADRIAANGDTANKIGTYEKALIAQANGIPFYIAAPTSTFDAACPDGGAIPIEERSPDEVLYAYGLTDDGRPGRVRLAPAGARARNPAFDVTPAALIRGIITEYGIVPPTREAIGRLLAGARKG